MYVRNVLHEGLCGLCTFIMHSANYCSIMPCKKDFSAFLPGFSCYTQRPCNYVELEIKTFGLCSRT